MKKLGLYKISVIIFFIALPVAAAISDKFIFKSEAGVEMLLLKWFVFCGIGLRLFTAGLKQVIDPLFTAKEIFDLDDEKCLPVVREIGLANISLGSVGILSLFVIQLRAASAIAGCLYFGLAGCLHLFNKTRSRDEMFPMISDFYIFLVIAALIMINYLNI